MFPAWMREQRPGGMRFPGLEAALPAADCGRSRLSPPGRGRRRQLGCVRVVRLKGSFPFAAASAVIQTDTLFPLPALNLPNAGTKLDAKIHFLKRSMVMRFTSNQLKMP